MNGKGGREVRKEGERQNSSGANHFCRGKENSSYKNPKQADFFSMTLENVVKIKIWQCHFRSLAKESIYAFELVASPEVLTLTSFTKYFSPW